jgi:DnaK suppressor protein
MNARKKALDSLVDELQRKRFALVGEVGQTEGELRTITEEREPELEEEAQKERLATVLERLRDRERRTLREIDDSLERIASGTYGTCAACGKPIPLGRLRALPTTRLCVTCARTHEGNGQPDETEEATVAGTPADLSLLDEDK